VAIARVQAASNNSTGTGTVAVTIAAATAGNLLVGCASVNEVAGDKDINTPTGFTAITPADINSTTKVRGRMWYKVAAGGETSVTFASASGTSDMAAWVIEFSGTAAASPEDQTNENTGSTSPATTGALATPVAGAVGVAFIAIVNNNTLEGTAVSGNATAANTTRIALLYNLAPGATNTGLTQSGTARPYVGQIASFKPASGTTFNQTLAVTSTMTAAMTRQTGKVLALGATMTAAIVRKTNKVLAVASTFTAAIVKRANKSLAVTTTFTAAVVRSAGKNLAVVATFTAAMTRTVGKTLAVGTAWAVSMVRRTNKTLAATGTWTVAISAGKAFLRTLAVTVTFGVSVGRTIGKKLAAVGSWVAGLLTAKTSNQPAYFLPPVVEFLHSKDRFVMVTNEKDEQMPSLSAQWRYRQFYRGPVAQQRLMDEEGYYSVGTFKFRGGYWNGPLTAAEQTAIQGAGLGSRIRTAAEPGLLPASIDP
jgi:hypothetical protein